MMLLLYREGLLNPKILKKFNIHLNHLEYTALCAKYKDEPRKYYPEFPLYDRRENDYFIKELQLSDGTTIVVKSKDIKQRIARVLRERNILTSKEYATAVYCGAYRGQLYTRNY